jgi:cell division protease FtsH
VPNPQKPGARLWVLQLGNKLKKGLKMSTETKPGLHFNLTYALLALLAVITIHDVWIKSTEVANIPYSEFQALIRENKVKELEISKTYIHGTLKNPAANGKLQFIANRVEPELAKEFAGSDAKVIGVVENTFLREILSWILPALIFVGIWSFVVRRMAGKGGGFGGGLMTIGKSKAKVYVETNTKITFVDIAGIDEAEDELQEIVSFLKNPQEYGRLGGRMPKGILLVGPPGTGKTLLAKAVAGEAGVPFFSISGSEFVEMFVGVGAARVRDLFEQARLKAPCIIFIDELDALGRTRAAGQFSGGHDEKEQTLNQLLVELDGFDTSNGLILLAATNRPEILDPALLRAGRFDRQILVDRPDKKGRMQILDVHLKKITALDPDLNREQIAAMTPGFTGADLANLVNEAALVATRRKATTVELRDFNEAIERIVAGLEKRNRILNEQERKHVAYHEMGHALVSSVLLSGDKVHKVSIIPRGIGALGYTIQRPTEDRYLITKAELEMKMVVLCGGRAAELLVFKQLSTGAADDLAKATDIARSMVTRFGMEETLGPVIYEGDRTSMLGDGIFTPKKYSDETARMIDLAVIRLLDKSFNVAQTILAADRTVLDESAAELLAKESLNEQALTVFFSKMKPRNPGEFFS